MSPCPRWTPQGFRWSADGQTMIDQFGQVVAGVRPEPTTEEMLDAYLQLEYGRPTNEL